ncbi:MAG: hypothetical protein ABL857_08570 [Rickettsiales bacterium]
MLWKNIVFGMFLMIFAIKAFATTTALTDPICVPNPSVGTNIFSSNPTPQNRFYIIQRYQLPSVANHISYPVGYYTHYYPPAPVSAYQFGYSDETNNPPLAGYPALQMKCMDAAWMMNSYQSAILYGYQNLSNTTFAYEMYPKKNVFLSNGSASLLIQADIEIPVFNKTNGGTNATGQAGLTVYLLDNIHQKTVAILGGAYSDRSITATYGSANGRNTGLEGAGGYYVGSAMNIDTRYTTPDVYSGTFTNSTWQGNRFYRMTITPTNIVNIATDLNNTYGAGLSTNPTDYTVGLFFAASEIVNCPGYAYDCNSRASMAMHVYGLGAYQKTP